DPLRGAANYGYALRVYPYMPATLLAYAPFVAAFGDFRFIFAGVFGLTVVLIRAAGRHLAIDGRFLDTITLLFLLHARSFALTALAGRVVAAATFAPFACWGWSPTLDGVSFQMLHLQAPRLDSDSIVAFVALSTGAVIGRWWSVGAQFAGAALAHWRLRNDG